MNSQRLMVQFVLTFCFPPFLLLYFYYKGSYVQKIDTSLLDAYVVYLAKDQIFLTKSDIGYGSATDAIFIPVEKWEVKGDRVLIPYENIATRKPVGMVALRLNNKNYESGENRTVYYVEKFELY